MRGMQLAVWWYLALFITSGCARPTADTTPVKEPTSLREGIQLLSPLIEEIVTEVGQGNPQACDDSLHDALFLSNHLEKLTEAQQNDDAREASIKLYALLMSTHNAAHGEVAEEGTTALQQSVEISSAFDVLQSSVATADEATLPPQSNGQVP